MEKYKLTSRQGPKNYGSETHLREVAYCDVIKRQMTSLLTLSDDIRQNEAFKEKAIFLLAFSQNSGSKYIFLPTGC